MVKNKDMQFIMENLKMKRKKDKKFLPSKAGFEPQIFSNFPAHDLNLSMTLIYINSYRNIYFIGAQTQKCLTKENIQHLPEWSLLILK